MAGADNQFRIRITADDQAGPIIQKLEGRLGKFAAKMALGKKVDDLSKSQLEQRVTQRFEGLAKKIQSVGSALGNTASNLSAPVSAIAGGAIVAGITASASSWASYGNSVLRTAQMTGVGTDELQKLRGAAKLAGIEAEQLDGGIGALGTTLNDATNGRNMAALAMLNRLGITIRHTKDGAIDTSAALKDLAQVMANDKMSPQTKAMIAGQFGVQGLMPMLMDGRKKLEDDMRKTEKMGAVQSPEKLKEADAAKRSEREAGLGHQRASNWLGDYVGPIYGKIMESAAKMLSEHPGMTLTGMAGVGLGGAWVVKKVMSSLGERLISSVATSLGKAVAGEATATASQSAAKAGLDKITRATLPFFGELASRISIGLSLLLQSDELNVGENAMVLANQKRYGIGSRSWHGLDLQSKEFADLKDKAKKAYQPTLEFGDEKALEYIKRYIKENPNAKPAGWTEDEEAPATPGQKLKQAAQPAPPQKAQSTKAMPRGIRNNNPGNLQFVGQTGAVKEGGAGGRFAVFNSPQAGLDAMAKQLKRYSNSGLNSVSDIVQKWAPSSENNTAAYVSAVAKRMGVSGSQSLDMSRPEVIRSLMDAMIVHENGNNPYSQKMLEASAASAVTYTGRSGSGKAVKPLASPVAAASSAVTGNAAVVEPSQKMLIEQLKSLQDAVTKLSDMKVQVAVSGLPAGARATATGGSAVASNTPRYSYPMPEMITP
ncbi:hypothetical protein [Chromobacterium sp. W521]